MSSQDATHPTDKVPQRQLRWAIIGVAVTAIIGAIGIYIGVEQLRSPGKLETDPDARKERNSQPPPEHPVGESDWQQWRAVSPVSP